ncbi:MAG TPA: LysR substrate-binding domain-containing protein [Woeseiaceae bacterium]|nr:LysR substrate-binding domain-containing protein [Woeseiaceae bacterium]
MDSSNLNLRHLRAMAAIERLGSATAAAQAISITQPAITQALAKLESQLDHQLFERRPDGMTKLPAATIFVPRVEAALEHIGSRHVTTACMHAMIALADAGSYAEASAVTGLAQSTLHRAVRDLSLVLKRSLVERRGKGIALTEQGRRTARSFRLARAELEAGLSELATLGGRETGRITIGAMPLCRARLLPAAAAAFHEKHPESEVVIVEGSFRELIEPLRDGVIDVMIGALRPAAPADDLIQNELLVDRLVVLGRKGHPLAKLAGNVATKDLADYPWAISARGTPLRIQWDRMFARAGIAPPKIPVESGSVIANREILRKSDFLTLFSPDQVAVELEAGWLARICEAPGHLERTIGSTTRAGWRPTDMQSSFLQILQDTAQEITLSKNL